MIVVPLYEGSAVTRLFFARNYSESCSMLPLIRAPRRWLMRIAKRPWRLNGRIRALP